MSRDDIGGADIAKRNEMKEACEANNLETVLGLLIKGFNVDPILSDDNYTALMIAAKKDHLKLVSLLLARGADVNYRNGNGAAINLACNEGHLEVVKVLFGACVNASASVGEAVDAVSKLEDEFSHTPLLCAGAYDHLEIVKHFKAIGVDFSLHRSSHGKGILHVAGGYASFDTLGYLLAEEGLVVGGKSGINQQDDLGYTPLYDTISGLGSTESEDSVTEAVKMLLEHGADPNIYRTSDERDDPLHCAVSAGKRLMVEVIRLLVEHGASLSKGDKDGRTVIDYAVHADKYDEEHQNCLCALLHAVAIAGHVSDVEPIVEQMSSGDINELDKDGCSAFRLACLQGRTEMARELIKHGADIGVVSMEEITDPAIRALLKSQRAVIASAGASKSGLFGAGSGSGGGPAGPGAGGQALGKRDTGSAPEVEPDAVESDPDVRLPGTKRVRTG